MKVFDYNLPDDRIAKYPLPKRDDSKLLVYRHGEIADSKFGDVAGLLPEGSLLVRNDTKVIRARLRFHKATGAAIEVFCLEPTLPSEAEQAFSARGQSQWKCIVGNSKRWKEGQLTLDVRTPGGDVALTATRLSQDGNTS